MTPPEEVGETQILAALLGIAQMMGDLTDTGEFLDAVVRIAPSLVRVDRCAILGYDDSLKEFQASDSFGPQGVGAAFEGLRIPAADMPRLAQRLVGSRLPALVTADSRDHALPPAVVRRLGLRSALLVPLVSRGRVLGLLWLDDSHHSHYFTSREVNVVQGIAASAAVALDGASRLDALALAHRRFEALARAVTDGVIVLDRDLRILELDRAAEDLLGWPSSEVRGRGANEVFAISGAEAGVAWTRASDRPSLAAKVLPLRSRDHGSIPCEVLVVPVRGESGGTLQVLYILRDRRDFPDRRP